MFLVQIFTLICALLQSERGVRGPEPAQRTERDPGFPVRGRVRRLRRVH